MTVIPTGYSLVTFRHLVPSAGGLRLAVCTIGVGQEPDDTLNLALSNAWQDAVWEPFGSGMSQYVGCEMRSTLYVTEDTLAVPGGSAGEPDSPQVSLLVRKSTGRAGRHFRGRMYPPAQVYTATYNAGGTMTGGSLPAYQAGYDDLWDQLTAADLSPYLLHNDETAPTAITSFVVDPVVATQRRRTGR